MERLCSLCKYKSEAKNFYDYFVKTGTYPDFRYWKSKDFEDKFWLCGSPDVSRKIHTNGTLCMKRCIEANTDGQCPFFCTENAEDIQPLEVKISAEKTELEVGEPAVIKITLSAYEKLQPPQKPDDETGGESEAGTENSTGEEQTIRSEPDSEITEKNQNITAAYKWFLNGRRLFNENSDSITIKPKKPADVDIYDCEVIQSIPDNGDGGIKSFRTLATQKISVKEQALPEIPDEGGGDTNIDTP